MGSNPAVYWMNISHASFYIFNGKGNKGSQMGHTKKYLKKNISKKIKLKLKLKLFFLFNTIYQCIDAHKGKGERIFENLFYKKTIKHNFLQPQVSLIRNSQTPKGPFPLDYKLLCIYASLFPFLLVYNSFL